MTWEFPKFRDTFLGVTLKKDYGILGSILGSLILVLSPTCELHLDSLEGGVNRGF